MWGGADYQVGDFYDGERTEIAAEINWRPSGRLRTGFGYEFNDIDLPQGSFVTRLAVFRTDVAFSSKLSWVTRIQYDNVSELMGINLRLHWVPEAGREGFIVINHDLEDFDLDNRFHSALSEASSSSATRFASEQRGRCRFVTSVPRPVGRMAMLGGDSSWGIAADERLLAGARRARRIVWRRNASGDGSRRLHG